MEGGANGKCTHRADLLCVILAGEEHYYTQQLANRRYEMIPCRSIAFLMGRQVYDEGFLMSFLQAMLSTVLSLI